MLDTLVTLFPPGLRAALRARAAPLVALWPARRPGGSVPLAGRDPKPAAMRPLRPPVATNDNPLLAVHEAVERDLRASGHLR
ncbi:hypothetical protein MKK69_20640 [Methylobacterium sp. J-026]|uniref:hypothetical protein n=1 Tax=Methylobacterium sp. J-026 TaxID=2836624 RepID=UPI001FBA1284|nr:hypothetical protein [Methylobacterium sp. J-026]MCJ2136429.1 hypothetical protein [Methylobacterium sp. J-026]